MEVIQSTPISGEAQDPEIIGLKGTHILLCFYSFSPFVLEHPSWCFVCPLMFKCPPGITCIFEQRGELFGERLGTREMGAHKSVALI